MGNDNVQKKFLQDMIKTTDRYIKFLMNNKYSKFEEEHDLGLDYSFGQEEVVPLYLMKILKMEIAGTRMISGVEVPKVKLTQIYTEREHTEENNQDQLEGFNMCGDDDLDYETGGACLWVINQERFDALPADQQGGFNNTAINDRVNALFNEDGKLTRKWFTGQDDDENIRLFGNGVKNEVNNGGEFYAHTHMAAFDDAFLRVYTYRTWLSATTRGTSGGCASATGPSWRASRTRRTARLTMRRTMAASSPTKMEAISTTMPPSRTSRGGCSTSRAGRPNSPGRLWTGSGSTCAAGTARTATAMLRHARTTMTPRSRRMSNHVLERCVLVPMAIIPQRKQNLRGNRTNMLTCHGATRQR